MFLNFVEILLAFSAKIGYLGVVLLMAVESSFIPFPSEIVIPPAAYLAAQGHFNIYLVILSGIAGSLIGALVNYYLAMTLGRKVIYALANTRLAKLILINEGKIQRAENYFLMYGRISTFLARLVPAVRQLISIPAGFCRMKLAPFLFYTFLGSGLWTVILAIVGYAFGANQEIFFKYYEDFKQVIYGVIGIVIIVILFYWARSIVRARLKNPKLPAPNSR